MLHRVAQAGRDLLVARCGPGDAQLLDAESIRHLLPAARHRTDDELLQLVAEALAALRDLEHHMDPVLAAEMLLLRTSPAGHPTDSPAA